MWSENGGICTGETYKNAVELTFYKGASLDDPTGLFNSSLEGKVRRAIDIKEGETIDEKALKSLVREAVALNLEKSRIALGLSGLPRRQLWPGDCDPIANYFDEPSARPCGRRRP